MSASPSFEKVGECLYRNPSSHTYFARVKLRGKEIKQTLKTKSLPEARRKLREFKADMERIDPDAGKILVEGLCDRYEKAIASQAPKTIRRKIDILTKIRKRWPATNARKVKKSDVQGWLASYTFGESSYNLHLECVRAIFRLGVDDRILPYDLYVAANQRSCTPDS